MINDPERRRESLEVRFLIAEEILLAQLSTQINPTAVVPAETETNPVASSYTG